MSKKYDEYLYNHINAVRKCMSLLMYGVDGSAIKYRELSLDELKTLEFDPCFDSWNVRIHDQSKFSASEYGAYDNYFYPSEKNRDSEEQREADFDKAWLHHQNANPHHWQYWLLMNDDNDGKFVPMNIPVRYLYEMVADWGAFSLLKQNPDELTEWYETHKDRIIINPDSRKSVEKILPRLVELLREYFRRLEE